MPDCLFCKIATKEIPSHMLWENERFFAFLDINPIKPGHMLIIPKEHMDSVFELPDPLYAELFQIAKTFSQPLKEVTGSIRIGMVVEGFQIAHAHVKLIPLNAGHELDQANARHAEDSELAPLAEKIKKALEAKLNTN